jgi:hypothetical protein
MISMRYAKNFVEHKGLVWNVGERVEGFTTPLWTLFMICAIWLFGTHYAPLAIQILGGMTCIAVFVIYCWAGIRNKASELAVVTGVLMLLLSYPISYWGLSGMEATAVCAVFAAAAAMQYSYEKGNSGNPFLVHSLLIAIAYCLRPDGWLSITPFFVASLFDSIGQKMYLRVFRGLAMIGAVMALVTAGRLAYYGAWVPNTYVLKVEGYSLMLRLSNGTSFVGEFFTQNFMLLALIGVSALSKKRIAFLNISAACITIAYQIYVGGDPWSSWRQLLQVYVVAAFAVLILFDYISELSVFSPKMQSPDRITLALVAVVASAPLVVAEYQVYQGDAYLPYLLEIYMVALLVALVALRYPEKFRIPDRKVQLLIHIARTLVVVVTIGSAIVGSTRFYHELRGKPTSFADQAELIDKAVLSMRLFGPGKTSHMAWAGTYPYYVEGKMIDALGKSDIAVARYPVDESIAWDGMKGVPGHSKYDFRDTILKRSPDIIVDYLAWGRQDLTPDLKDSYTLIKDQGVSLCVKNELAAMYENLASGSCPRNLF